MIMMTMMMSDFLTMLICNKNTSNNTVYHSSYFIGMSVPHGPSPLFSGHVLMPWLSFSLVFV